MPEPPSRCHFNPVTKANIPRGRIYWNQVPLQWQTKEDMSRESLPGNSCQKCIWSPGDTRQIHMQGHYTKEACPFQSVGVTNIQERWEGLQSEGGEKEMIEFNFWSHMTSQSGKIQLLERIWLGQLTRLNMDFRLNKCVVLMLNFLNFLKVFFSLPLFIKHQLNTADISNHQSTTHSSPPIPPQISW